MFGELFKLIVQVISWSKKQGADQLLEFLIYSPVGLVWFSSVGLSGIRLRWIWYGNAAGRRRKLLFSPDNTQIHKHDVTWQICKNMTEWQIFVLFSVLFFSINSSQKEARIKKKDLEERERENDNSCTSPAVWATRRTEQQAPPQSTKIPEDDTDETVSPTHGDTWNNQPI